MPVGAAERAQDRDVERLRLVLDDLAREEGEAPDEREHHGEPDHRAAPLAPEAPDPRDGHRVVVSVACAPASPGASIEYR